MVSLTVYHHKEYSGKIFKIRHYKRLYLRWLHKSSNQGFSFKYSPNIETASITASVTQVRQCTAKTVKQKGQICMFKVLRTASRLLFIIKG